MAASGGERAASEKCGILCVQVEVTLHSRADGSLVRRYLFSVQQEAMGAYFVVCSTVLLPACSLSSARTVTRATISNMQKSG